MNVHLPGNRRELVPYEAVRAVPRAGATSWWKIGVVLVVGACLAAVLRDGPAPLALPWVTAAALAAVAWARAAGRSQSRARVVFWTLAGAAVVALAAVVAWQYETPSLAPGEVPAGLYLLIAPYVIIAVGAALGLGAPRLRAWKPALVVDGLLVFLAGSAATLRLVLEPLVLAGDHSLAFLAGLQTVAGVPVLVAAVLVLHRGSVFSPRSAVLLLAATLVFGAGTLLSLAGADPEPLRIGNRFDLVWVIGWLLFAGSGALAREDASTESVMLNRRRLRDALRKMIVPGAAVFMAAAVLDIGLGRPPQAVTVGVIALFGIVLAVRTGHALRIADRDDARRRQLAHTRALVDVTHSLAGTTDLDATLQTISESARSVFGTRAAGIELVTSDGGSLETRAAVGLPDSVVGLRFPIEGSFTGWVVRHGKPRATVDPARDPYIQPQSLDFLGHWPVAAAPIRFRGETLGALFACMRDDPFDAEELELLNAMAEQAAIAIENARLFERVSQMSVTDPLTGLANRRQLQHELGREFAAARRGRDLAVVMFDLDEFKNYNDAHGHLVGDRALVAFAHA
ncbi:MAG: diguanylate cyclase domain-containing protein, partial [Gemmatimonadota bacterium]